MLKNKIFTISLLVLTIVLTSFYVYNFFSQTVNGDESILAEQTKELANNGFVRSPVFTGMGQGWEISQLHYHKFFIWSGALIYKTLGTSITAYRSFSLLCLLIIVILFFYIFRKDDSRWQKFMLSIILLLSGFVFWKYGVIYRPETAVSMFALGSFYFLNSYLNKKIYYHLLLSALFAGLAALTHLNGLSVIFAGSVLLLWNKKWKNLIVFDIISVAIILFYFIDINTIEKFNQFISQFSSDPNFESDNFSVFAPLLKVFDEHMRFFHDLYSSTFSTLFLLVVIASFKYLRKQKTNLLIYFFALVIGLSSVTHGPTVKYMILYSPFMVLIIIYGLSNIINKKHNNRILTWGISSVFMIFIITNYFYISNNIIQNIDTIKKGEFINSNIPVKNVNVLAPAYFYFNQEKNFNIRIPLAYVIKTNDYKIGDFTATDFYNYNRINNNRYIILDKQFSQDEVIMASQYEQLSNNAEIEGYRVIFSDVNLKILELIN